MNKKWFIRFAFIVVIITCSSMCMIGGTLATFVTSDSNYDVAYIAEWGIEVSTVTIGDSSVLMAGDSGSFVLHWEGTPEVSATINVVSTTEYVGTWLDESGNTYAPIQWGLVQGVGTTSDDVTTWLTLTELEGSLSELSATYVANTAIYDTYTIFWKWELYAYSDADAQIMEIVDYVNNGYTYYYCSSAGVFTYKTYYYSSSYKVLVLPTINMNFEVTLKQAQIKGK